MKGPLLRKIADPEEPDFGFRHFAVGFASVRIPPRYECPNHGHRAGHGISYGAAPAEAAARRDASATGDSQSSAGMGELSRKTNERLQHFRSPGKRARQRARARPLQSRR